MELKKIKEIVDYIKYYVKGQDEEIPKILACLFCKKHVVLAGESGCGKTFIVERLAEALGQKTRDTGGYKKITGTPDLFPNDILKTVDISEENNKTKISISDGVLLLGNILFVDEWKRINPKTLSILLDAMNDGTVVDGKEIKKLGTEDNFFWTIMAHNPTSRGGSYEAPTAIYDRVAMEIEFESLNSDDLFKIIEGEKKEPPSIPFLKDNCFPFINTINNAIKTYITMNLSNSTSNIVKIYEVIKFFVKKIQSNVKFSMTSIPQPMSIDKADSYSVNENKEIKKHVMLLLKELFAEFETEKQIENAITDFNKIVKSNEDNILLEYYKEYKNIYGYETSDNDTEYRKAFLDILENVKIRFKIASFIDTDTTARMIKDILDLVSMYVFVIECLKENDQNMILVKSSTKEVEYGKNIHLLSKYEQMMNSLKMINQLENESKLYNEQLNELNATLNKIEDEIEILPSQYNTSAIENEKLKKEMDDFIKNQEENMKTAKNAIRNHINEFNLFLKENSYLLSRLEKSILKDMPKDVHKEEFLNHVNKTINSLTVNLKKADNDSVDIDKNLELLSSLMSNVELKNWYSALRVIVPLTIPHRMVFRFGTTEWKKKSIIKNALKEALASVRQ